MYWAVRQACLKWGAGEVLKYYGIPWLCVTHWFIMITYLHHTDPELPHYRNKEWSFSRGAAATVDRDFLGWMGRFFLHDVAHYHVVHHFFPKMPFCKPGFHCQLRYNIKLTIRSDHGPEATTYLREFIGDHYRHSNKPVFKALWENYNDCQFVEDTGKCSINLIANIFLNQSILEGDILFYRDKKGRARMQPTAYTGRSS